MKRFFDLLISIISLVLLSPILVIVSFSIIVDNGFPIFFVQRRVGRYEKEFGLIKFRSMRNLRKDESDLQITIGRNERITIVGSFLRKYKLDELPQLINILKGDMSFVGPRPEVPQYVALYNSQQLNVLTIRPGLTDYASIKYRNESEILESSSNPERMYIEKVMPDKLKINLEYVSNQSFIGDLVIILKTLRVVLSKSP